MEIVEDRIYQEKIDSHRINWKRLDDALMTLYPALLGSPELFPQVPGTKLRRLKLVGFRNVPPLSIFFTLEKDKITLKTAELIDIES
jgi:hypothetical protein